MRTAREVSQAKNPRQRASATKHTGDKILGRKLLTARQTHGLTLRDVEAATGVSAQGVSLIEHGVSMPLLSTAVSLAAFYELSLDELCAHADWRAS